MRDLFKNWKIVVLLLFLFLSLLSISFNGLKYGIDFNGGTQFQIHLEKPLNNPEEISQVTSIISRRLDWTGLKDTKVHAFGNEFIIVQVAETSPKQVERIELLLKKQGKFEATLDGKTIFSGADILHIYKDSSKGYGIIQQEQGFEWRLPFLLSQEGAKKFTEMTFHQCTISGFDPQQGKTFDCKKTYFFIDRPKAVILMPPSMHSKDKELLLQGNLVENIPSGTEIDELLLNAQTPLILTDSNISASDKNKLVEYSENFENAILPKGVYSRNILDDLNALGFKVTEIEREKNVPWIWNAVGAKEVVSLSEDVTNMNPYVEDLKDAKTYSELVIRGFGSSEEDALTKLSNLSILLESGSLPIGVESIGKETISPNLGKEFLFVVGLMGIIALVVVVLVLFVRYREPRLVIPIGFTVLSEVLLILGFASFIKWSLDLASLAGIIAAVGTGVDHQIIISDELLRKEADYETSFVNRVKRAFFIIFAAAATSLATMSPIILFGFGLGKLIGFAITTISGVLIGVFITRPAFGEIAKYLLARK
jgi:preprotein translocase subunit SecD